MELLDDWQMLGMRSTISCGVRFNDVFVPADHIVGGPGDWIHKDPRTFSCAYAANHIGSAQAAFDFIADYVGARDDLNGSEVVRVRLGRMDAKLFAARACLAATAARLDRGDDPDEVEADAVRTMHLAKDAVLAIPYEGFDLLGARACHERYPLGQMLRDARTFTAAFPRRSVRGTARRDGAGSGLLRQGRPRRLHAVRRHEGPTGPGPRRSVIVVTHRRLRRFNTRDTYPNQSLDNDLCQVVVAGNTVYLRGQVGSDFAGNIVGRGDPAAQAEQAMANVSELLAEAGSDLSHIVKTTVYITDPRYREPVYQVIGRWLKGVYPVSTGLVVDGLAQPEWLMEIDVIAVIPDDAGAEREP